MSGFTYQNEAANFNLLVIMRNKKNIIFSFVSIAISITALTQAVSQPKVGKPMPDFNLNNIRNYKVNQATLESFKGKWLFLDLWSYSCTACIASFPKVNELQKKFSNDVQFVLVGYNSQRYNKGIEKLYERVSTRFNLEVAAAFDSVLFERWDIASVPHIYIIDPEGVLRFITGGRDMTSEKIQQLIEGKEVSFYSKDIDLDRPDFDVAAITGKNKLLYSSTLTEWNGEKQNTGYPVDIFVKVPELWKEGWKVSMAPLFELYNYAYLGRGFWLPYDTLFYENVYAFPVLEVKDSSFFQFDYNFNVGKHTYNYCLKLPDAKINVDYIKTEMQRSLKSVFGYDISIENRQMPVWKLIANPGAKEKLQTKSKDKPFFSGGNSITGFTVKNYPVKRFLSLVTASLSNNERLAFVNETGITSNIDFTIDTDMTSYDSIRTVLQKNGLDLVKGEKEMKVIVIRDPKK